MKILYLNQLYAPNIAGGSEICLQEEVEGMRGRGHDVVVLCTGERAGVHEDTINGVRVLRAGIENIYWHYSKEPKSSLQRRLWHLKDSYNIRMARIVREVLAVERPDVVAAHTLPGWSSSAWSAIADAKIPLLQVLHDLYHMCPNTQMFKKGCACVQQCIECKLLRMHSRKASLAVSAVVGVSNFVLNRHVSAGYFQNAAQKTVIYNARSISPVRSTRVREHSPSEIRFGFIGTISQAKGIELLLSEFSKVGGGAKLVVAGKGNPDFVDGLVRTYAGPQIEFLGYSRPEDFFAQIDVLIVPSIWNDTYPGVAVEGCIYGVPVIGSNMGGIPEIVEDKVTGLIFDAARPESLLAALQYFIDSPDRIKVMGAAAKVSSKSMVDTHAWLDKYEMLYGQLTGAQLG